MLIVSVNAYQWALDFLETNQQTLIINFKRGTEQGLSEGKNQITTFKFIKLFLNIL